MSVQKISIDDHDAVWPAMTVVGGHVSWANVVVAIGLVVVGDISTGPRGMS